MFSLTLAFLFVPLLVKGAPTIPDPKDVKELVSDAATDVSNLAVAKAAAVGFVGGAAINSASIGAEAVLEKAVNSGNAAVEAGGAAVEYVASIDAIGVLNETEEAVRGKNDAIISGVFDAKRQAIKAVRDIAKKNEAAIHTFINVTGNGLNAAIDSTQQGLAVSKKIVSDVAAQVTVENAQLGLSAAKVTVSSALNATLAAVESSGAMLINSLIKAKQGLQEAAENFDSKSTKDNLGATITLSVDKAGKVFEDAGFYSAIDKIVHSLAGVPTAINQYLIAKKQRIVGKLDGVGVAVDGNDGDRENKKGGAAVLQEMDSKEERRKTAREFTEEELLEMLRKLEKNKIRESYY